jgi:hypothetical protein
VTAPDRQVTHSPEPIAAMNDLAPDVTRTLRASCEPAGHTIIMSKVAKQRPVHTLDTVHYRFQLLCINKNVQYFQFGAHLKSQNSIGMFHGVVDNYKELFLQLQYTSWHCCR